MSKAIIEATKSIADKVYIPKRARELGYKCVVTEKGIKISNKTNKNND